MAAGVVEPRTLAPLCWAFRKGGPGDRVEPWTRSELALATGTPEAYLTPHLEALSEVGFLLKGKKGSRAVYSRPQECRTARPDLPNGWYWNGHISFPRGVRCYDVHLYPGKWHPSGGPLSISCKGDPPEFAAISLGSEERTRELVKVLGSQTGRGVQADVDAWRGKHDEQRRRGMFLGFDYATWPDGAYLQVPLAGEPDRLNKLGQFAADLAFEAYNARRRY
jgi:hypothetical protein